MATKNEEAYRNLACKLTLTADKENPALSPTVKGSSLTNKLNRKASTTEMKIGRPIFRLAVQY